MSPMMLWSLALLALGGAALLVAVGRRVEQAVEGGARPLQARRQVLPRDSLREWLVDYLIRAGIPLEGRGMLAVAAVLTVVLLGVVQLLGAGLGLLVGGGGLVLLNLLIRLRADWLRRRLRDQLPAFMEQVVREIGVGATLEVAFRRQVERVPPPLQEALRRVRARRDLGMELHEGLAREASLLKIHEFALLATAVEINQSHGGGLKEILESFVDLLRQQERGRRELSALTGETRVTAVVLAGMPVVLAGFMLASNPGFLAPMLASEGGRLALGIAVALELGGCFVLWRMLRSV